MRRTRGNPGFHCVLVLWVFVTNAMVCAIVFAQGRSSWETVPSEATAEPDGLTSETTAWEQPQAHIPADQSPWGDPRAAHSPLLDPSLDPQLQNAVPPVLGFGIPGKAGRHRGLGDPLEGTSWRNRPFHAGWMCGVLIGDDLVRGRVDQHTNLVGGYRLGWDPNHYWGVEGRFAFSHLDFSDTVDPTISHTSENYYWDVDFLYYPWGDSRWRPFASVGVGVAHFDYIDGRAERIAKGLFSVPVGGGVKYYWRNWLALRISAVDNWAIGRGPLNTMHNVAITGDVELRFGGRRTSYFPYNGSMHLW